MSHIVATSIDSAHLGVEEIQVKVFYRYTIYLNLVLIRFLLLAVVSLNLIYQDNNFVTILPCIFHANFL